MFLRFRKGMDQEHLNIHLNIHIFLLQKHLNIHIFLLQEHYNIHIFLLQEIHLLLLVLLLLHLLFFQLLHRLLLLPILFLLLLLQCHHLLLHLLLLMLLLLNLSHHLRCLQHHPFQGVKILLYFLRNSMKTIQSAFLLNWYRMFQPMSLNNLFPILLNLLQLHQNRLSDLQAHQLFLPNPLYILQFSLNRLHYLSLYQLHLCNLYLLHSHNSMFMSRMVNNSLKHNPVHDLINDHWYLMIYLMLFFLWF